MLLKYQVLEVISTQSNVLKRQNYDSLQKLKFLDFITHLLRIKYTCITKCTNKYAYFHKLCCNYQTPFDDIWSYFT